MANYKKSFSFRHGVQVDNDNFIVNTNGLVGIGTTVPTKHLDVRGNASISGLLTASGYNSSGVSTFQNDVKVGTGITFDTSTNTIIAPNIKIGTSPSISNVVGYSTVGWIVNETAYGISTDLNVGIQTDAPLEYQLTVGGNPSLDGETGIGVTGGNITATGSISANSLSGTVSVDDLDGTIGDDHLPDIITSNINISSGISTFKEVGVTTLTVTGTLTGNASTAQGLTGTPDITVGVTTVSRLKVTNIGVETESPEQPIQVGIATTANDNVCVITKGKIGIGTTNPSKELEIHNRSNATVKLTSGESNKSIVSVGVATTATNRKGELEYNSDSDHLTLKNYSGKNIHLDVTTVGSDSGKVIVRSANTQVFGITSEGKVAINKNSDPIDNHSLEVNGSALIGGATSITGSLTVDSDGTPFTLTGGTQTFPIDPNQNLNSNSGISTFAQLNIIDSSGIEGINISGAGIGQTVAIGSTTTLFDDKSVSIGVTCSISGEANFTGSVSLGSSVTDIVSISTSVGIGTTQNDPVTGIGTTAKVSFDVPDWATSTRVSFTELSTGLGQRGFRLRVNDQSVGYNGSTLVHFEDSAAYNHPYPLIRMDWSDPEHAGCFVGLTTDYLSGNEFGKMVSASGYVDFSILDPDLDTLQVMVSGIINLRSTTGVSSHNGQATLSGYISLTPSTGLSTVSVAGTQTGFLHVGIATNSNTYTTPAYVNATNFR